MKGVKHFTKDGKEYKGATHKMADGSLHTGATHTSKSVALVHKSDLKGGQKKLDANKNNKIDKQDFAMLREMRKRKGLMKKKQMKNDEKTYS